MLGWCDNRRVVDMTWCETMPWLKGLVMEVGPGGALICFHHRQLSVCAQCAPKAERRWREWQMEQADE